MKKQANPTVEKLIASDALLAPWRSVLERRAEKVQRACARLTGSGSLLEAARAHEFFGLHLEAGEWIFREWAPYATAIYLLDAQSGWCEDHAPALNKIDAEGIWELRLPLARLRHEDLYRLKIHWPGGSGDRIPAYTRRVVQDPQTLIFNAQVWQPATPYPWQHQPLWPPDEPLLIYEAHVGMAQEGGKVGSFSEFRHNVLPRIAAAGYNTIQLMAIQEHPYYGSFGYQVSSFYAVSSRFGNPVEFKALVDAAHGMGLRVVMDLVHSHAVRNEVEGLSRFDGTTTQYFHAGARGEHAAWDSRCFDYNKRPVLQFLLSNCRFFLEEYQIDGFRFDGVTSMLYTHHGLERAFTSYDLYFDDTVDEEALTYLHLANRLIHQINPQAVTIAEDISGMPGLAVPQADGGTGFDYRFAMGVPDFWIKLVKDTPDETWPIGQLWWELNNRRHNEKSISYAESHDQALVGDQTLIFRLAGPDLYADMHVNHQNFRIDRALALHKLIRFITLLTAGQGYLNFMGNEFGHPEWIDFPRAGNQWSYHYARRQWHLMEDPNLKYGGLARFDRDMLQLVSRHHVLRDDPWPQLCYEHLDDQILAFERNRLWFVFNFHPTRTQVDYPIPAPSGTYRHIFDTDACNYNGPGRMRDQQMHFTLVNPHAPAQQSLSLYLPTRCALVLEKVDGEAA